MEPQATGSGPLNPPPTPGSAASPAATGAAPACTPCPRPWPRQSHRPAPGSARDPRHRSPADPGSPQPSPHASQQLHELPAGLGQEAENLTGVLEATVRDPSRSGPGTRLKYGLTHSRKRRRRRATRPHFHACEASPEEKQGAQMKCPIHVQLDTCVRKPLVVELLARCRATRLLYCRKS